MHINVDQEACTGCGVCESLCPELFQVQEDEKAHVVNPENCETCDCREAVDSCPAQAISVEE